CLIVRVKTKTKSHKASLTEDFQQMKQLVLEEKKKKVLDGWIRQKQTKTYVRINDNWRNCEFKYPGWIKQGS
ncbi:MAG: peptidylprolyl isomerase, partial [Bacteroidota bacterium]|nr:peptidylprolyl isomerase [Bacteroidota bacterium]